MYTHLTRGKGDVGFVGLHGAVLDGTGVARGCGKNCDEEIA
jgi:hypothetical protein